MVLFPSSNRLCAPGSSRNVHDATKVFSFYTRVATSSTSLSHCRSFAPLQNLVSFSKLVMVISTTLVMVISHYSNKTTNSLETRRFSNRANSFMPTHSLQCSSSIYLVSMMGGEATNIVTFLYLGNLFTICT